MRDAAVKPGDRFEQDGCVIELERPTAWQMRIGDTEWQAIIRAHPDAGQVGGHTFPYVSDLGRHWTPTQGEPHQPHAHDEKGAR